MKKKKIFLDVETIIKSTLSGLLNQWSLYPNPINTEGQIIQLVLLTLKETF